MEQHKCCGKVYQQIPEMLLSTYLWLIGHFEKHSKTKP